MPTKKTRQQLVDLLNRGGEQSYNDLLNSVAFIDEMGGVNDFKIERWVSGSETNIGFAKTHVINRIEYLFYSKINKNTSEPTLQDTAAWLKTPYNYEIEYWDQTSSYNQGQFVIDVSNRVFESVNDNNIDNNPLLDTDGIYWSEVGNYKGVYEVGSYDLYDFVFDELDDNIIYISQLDNNAYLLTDNNSGTWQLVGLGAFEAQCIPTSSDETFIII